jgi:hypothetical protein
MNSTPLANILKIAGALSGVLATIATVRWIKSRHREREDARDFQLIKQLPWADQKRIRGFTAISSSDREKRRIALNTIRLVVEMRYGAVCAAYNICNEVEAKGMDFSENGPVTYEPENPLALWATLRGPQYMLRTIFLTLVTCGASVWINRPRNTFRPIDQSTSESFPILMEYRTRLNIDVMPTADHSPLYRMIAYGFDSEQCIQLIRVMRETNPDFFDWIHPKYNTTALHLACLENVDVDDPNDKGFRVVTELLATGAVDPDHECFRSWPISEPPFLIEALNGARKERVRHRALVREEVRRHLDDCFPSPLIMIVQNYIY